MMMMMRGPRVVMVVVEVVVVVMVVMMVVVRVVVVRVGGCWLLHDVEILGSELSLWCGGFGGLLFACGFVLVV